MLDGTTHRTLVHLLEQAALDELPDVVTDIPDRKRYRAAGENGTEPLGTFECLEDREPITLGERAKDLHAEIACGWARRVGGRGGRVCGSFGRRKRCAVLLVTVPS